MTFDEILPAVQAGCRATRPDWPGTWLEEVHPPPLPDGRTLAPVLVIGCPDPGRELWTWGRSDRDIGGDDWTLL